MEWPLFTWNVERNVHVLRLGHSPALEAILLHKALCFLLYIIVVIIIYYVCNLIVQERETNYQCNPGCSYRSSSMLPHSAPTSSIQIRSLSQCGSPTMASQIFFLQNLSAIGKTGLKQAPL
jgi:hypothetical protein